MGLRQPILCLEKKLWFIEPQYGPTFHEHALQGFHIILNVRPFVHTHRGELPSLLNSLTLCTTQSHSLGVDP